MKAHKKEQNIYRGYPDPDEPEAIEQLAKMNRAYREVSEAKIRVATAEANAIPFGTDDAEKIARQIVDRTQAVFHVAGRKYMNMPESRAIAEKRKALAIVLEKITVTNDTIATLTIRGGLEYALGEPIHAQTNGSFS
ncbi:MAG TPA: hypothetical protein VE959_17245 [Bryobacteraceae bacterium]|nr:hypothetical protein [Bryobacteraceae bacterium]